MNLDCLSASLTILTPKVDGCVAQPRPVNFCADHFEIGSTEGEVGCQPFSKVDVVAVDFTRNVVGVDFTRCGG